MAFLLRFHEFYQNTYDFHGFPYKKYSGRCPDQSQIIRKSMKIIGILIKFHENEAKMP